MARRIELCKKISQTAGQIPPYTKGRTQGSNPASDSIQVEYNSGETLSSKDVRFVFLRVDPQTQTISSILVLTPDYIENRFGRFGKPTIKHQVIIPPKIRDKVLARNPPGIFCLDTSALSQHVTEKYSIPTSSMSDKPIFGQLFSLKLLREMLVEGLIGEPLDQMATKNRGQALERLVACLLGYKISDAELLEGNFPDIAILYHLRDIVYCFNLGKRKYFFCRMPLTNRSLICSKQVVHNA